MLQHHYTPTIYETLLNLLNRAISGPDLAIAGLNLALVGPDLTIIGPGLAIVVHEFSSPV